SSQVGAPAKFALKSVPCTSAPETGVTPSAWNTRAVIAAGTASQVPPEGGFGSRSRIVRFHAGPLAASWPSRVDAAGVPGDIAGGPLLVSVSTSGPTIVMGGVVPGRPGCWLIGLPFVMSNV